MNHNPYQAPGLLGEDASAATSAKRRVAPVAIGLQCSGAFFAFFGALGVVMAILLLAKIAPVLLADSENGGPPPEVIEEGVGFLWEAAKILAGSTLSLLFGGLAFYAGKRLRRLDSLRWAYAACGLSIVFYPICFITLPLGVYGLFVLRRADVRAVIQEQQAARKGTMPADEPQPV